jgi:CCR4-NOT transcription complex subunit 9
MIKLVFMEWCLTLCASCVVVQEIVAIYPMLSPPTLTAQASNRVCNALALLQCVASHPETRALFLQGLSAPPRPTLLRMPESNTHRCFSVPRVSTAHIPMYLYPFLNTVSKSKLLPS